MRCLEYGAVQTKGGNILQFGHYVDKDGEQVFKRVAVSDFAVSASHAERTQHESRKGVWFESEGALPAYTVEEVLHGLQANKDVWIVLALCRFSLGICIHVLLLSLIINVLVPRRRKSFKSE